MTLLDNRYHRAEKLLAWNLAPKLKNLSLQPHWLDEHRFWFKRDLAEGWEIVRVDTRTLTETIVGQPSSRKVSNGTQINNSDQALSVVSPNGKYAVIARDNNLYLLDLTTSLETPLTDDGESHYGYGTYADFFSAGLVENKPLAPAVQWSVDSRYLAVQRIDERQVNDIPLMQSVPTDGSFRPKAQTYKMALPGDAHIPMVSLCVIDIETGRIREIGSKSAFIIVGPMEGRAVQWSEDNGLYFTEFTRDMRTVRLVGFDPARGESRVLIQENGQGNIYPGPFPFGPPVFKVLAAQNEFIWYSQRSGWGHLYRYDLTTGELKNPITSGDYVVTQIYHVDVNNGRVYFSACGRESDCNPYYERHYCINLDGSDLVLLTPESCQHDICGFSPQSDMFIDSFSRVDLPTKSVLRSTDDGSILMELSYCDQSVFTDIPYTPPFPFSAKASDGETDLWGVIYRPSDFDGTKHYPVILCIYGTPCECIAPIRFGQMSDRVRDIYRTLAELGFMAVVVDPRGTPLRSKAFHDMAYGNLQNGGGIDDQVAVLKQLGERYPWMDMDKVGITGHSGGGFASARAMLTHPDFFKVAVSCAGNYDQRLYAAGWGETFQGLPEGHNYKEQACLYLAQNLKGKLMLVHGDMDANVHIAHTLQLANQLIEHNKDFDLLILPNRGHQYAQDTYFIRRLWDYFVEHLLQETPPQQYRITPTMVSKT